MLGLTGQGRITPEATEVSKISTSIPKLCLLQHIYEKTSAKITLLLLVTLKKTKINQNTVPDCSKYLASINMSSTAKNLKVELLRPT